MSEREIQIVRDFNRFYTNVLGLVSDHILESDYSLPEARVLYELHHHQPCTASTIILSINMDKGYLSRILKAFERKGILAKKQSKMDGRVSRLLLTKKGEREFRKINSASAFQIKHLLNALNQQELKEAIHCMEQLKEILGKARV